jgi:signal transduction histidine kinase
MDNIALHSRISESQQLLQKVIDSTPVFLGVKGVSGKFILVNEALSEAAGYASPKDMVGEEDWGDYFPANSMQEEANVLLTGEEAITLSVMGRDRCFNTTRKYVEGAGVLPPMVVSTLVDITDLNTITKRLESFTHIASHDLQEPLRTITSFLGLLKKRHSDQISGQAMHYVDTAIDASTRMGALLSDLLSYSRLGSNPRPFTKLLLANVLMKALGNVSSKLIHISCPTIMYDPGSFPEVWGDEVQLITCLQNLLSNAIKFGDGSPVEVEHSSNNTHWEVRVIDHGIGIPEGMQEAIFKPFKRAHSAYEGTGMGLAIVEKVAHMHQGEAWATTTQGGGTTIHITLRKL